jgi:hypothetical protein
MSFRRPRLEYRRILELVANGTHFAVLRANMEEELALIESVPHGEVDLDFTGAL